MEENKLEEIVDETTVKNVEKPEVQEAQEDTIKVDMKKTNFGEQEPDIHKVDFSKPPETKEDEIKEDNADNGGVVDGSEDADTTQEQKEVQPEAEAQETPIVEEITEEAEKQVEEIAEQAEKAIATSEPTGAQLPENVQKLIDFMNDTGGDLVDYVKLNQDYSKLDDKSMLKEYYKQTKTHLDDDEINFLMEDEFSFDEDTDDEREIRKKKIALKEQVANAKSHLDGLKSKYYQELKAGSRLTPEQQKAQEFFNRYKQTTEESSKRSEVLASNFSSKTDNFFGDGFKGFEYNVGDKRFRFNVNNADEIKNTQSNVNNFVGKFLNEKTGALEDAAGYHKSLFTAMNSDAIAKHFYEQGKADATKSSIAKAKNISMDPRQSHGKVTNTGGPQFKVLGDNSSGMQWKIKK